MHARIPQMHVAEEAAQHWGVRELHMVMATLMIIKEVLCIDGEVLGEGGEQGLCCIDGWEQGDVGDVQILGYRARCDLQGWSVGIKGNDVCIGEHLYGVWTDTKVYICCFLAYLYVA